jgi:hypothetical protein
MKLFVIVRAAPSGQFTAQVPGISELEATATTKEEAIHAVRNLLSEWLASGQLVAIEVPGENPWLKWAGHIDPNDHGEQEYLEELERFRREDRERTLREYDQECSDSSSTPTT